MKKHLFDAAWLVVHGILSVTTRIADTLYVLEYGYDRPLNQVVVVSAHEAKLLWKKSHPTNNNTSMN